MMKNLIKKYLLFLTKIKEEYNWFQKLITIPLHLFYILGISVILYIPIGVVILPLNLFTIIDTGPLSILTVLDIIWLGFILFKIFGTKSNRVGFKVDLDVNMKESSDKNK